MNEIEANKYFLQANKLYQEAKFDEAIFKFNELILLFPDEPNSKAMQGLCYLAKNELKKAFDYLEEALSFDSNNVFFLTSMGSVLMENENYIDATKCLDRAISIDNKSTDALNSLGIIHYKQQDFVNSKKYFGLSYDISKSVSSLQYLVYFAKKDLDYANVIKYFLDILKIDDAYKSFDNILYDIATAYMNTSDYDNAIYYFEKNTQYNPSHKSTYNSLGICYQNLLNIHKAKENYTKAFSIEPNFAKAHWNLSTLYLLISDYDNGWKKYEWRKEMDKYKDSTHGTLPSTTPYNNQDLKGKVLSVKSEQGLGDTIQFGRYIKMFDFNVIDKILFRIHSDLVGLFKQFETDKIQVVGEGNMNKLYSDYEIELMSLPLFFNTKINNIPYSEGYLKEFKKTNINISKNKLNIGIVWLGNSDNNNNTKRTIPLSKLTKVIKLDNCQFYSLQKQNMQDEINYNNLQNDIINLSTKINDWQDTASMMNELDLVISVDTSIAHLGGAMGIKSIILLQYMPDFRWLLDTNKSPWYDSISLIRQNIRDEWDDVIDELYTRLKGLK